MEIFVYLVELVLFYLIFTMGYHMIDSKMSNIVIPKQLFKRNGHLNENIYRVFKFLFGDKDKDKPIHEINRHRREDRDFKSLAVYVFKLFLRGFTAGYIMKATVALISNIFMRKLYRLPYNILQYSISTFLLDPQGYYFDKVSEEMHWILDYFWVFLWLLGRESGSSWRKFDKRMTPWMPLLQANISPPFLSSDFPMNRCYCRIICMLLQKYWDDHVFILQGWQLRPYTIPLRYYRHWKQYLMQQLQLST